jgi:hypothetical protein
MNRFRPLTLLALPILTFILIFQINGKDKPKEKDNVPVEKEIIGKVTSSKDVLKMSSYYHIGPYQVVSSVEPKVKEFEGKTVKAFCRIYEKKRSILRIETIEEYVPPKKDAKKK